MTTFQAQTNLEQWHKILDLTIKSRIKLNNQTNFGLTQLSADRLYLTFYLAKNSGYDTDILIGKFGALMPKKADLNNTAIAIRRLIWFYQDFAQGRIVQPDARIHQRDIKTPEAAAKYKMGLKAALLYCGTQHMFYEKYPTQGKTYSEKLEEAIASIAYCKLGNPYSGYAQSEFDAKCFAEWITLCPALNVDMALLIPLSYFESRGSKPVCIKTFNRLINKNPDAN